MFAQPIFNGIETVTVSPSGACSVNQATRLNVAVNPPSWWGCPNTTLTWTQLNTGSSGTGNPGGSTYSTQSNGGGSNFAGTGPGTSGQLYLAQGGSGPALFETMSGDATINNTGALTFATVNSNVGSCGDATHVSQITLNAKGLATACTPVSITVLSLTLTTTGTSGAATLVGSTLNIPQYQGALTLTTTGTSGAATLVGNTLNIPQYTGGGGGTVTSVGLIGTSNQITVTGASPITGSGSWTLSIPTNPTLPGTTTGTFSGNLTGNVTGNVSGTAATITGLLALANTPLTTSQDILYDNAGSLARLPIVTSGTCLGNTGGVWASIACNGSLTVEAGGTSTGTAAATLNFAASSTISTTCVYNSGSIRNDCTPGIITTAVPTWALLQSNQGLYCPSTNGTISYTCNLNPVLSAYTAGQVFAFSNDVASGTGPSLEIASLSNLTLYQIDGLTAPITNQIVAGSFSLIYYDGTKARIAQFLPVLNGNASTCLSGIDTWVACSTSGGTVTSVSFTGGLISVTTATTTPALTVAGTSGGIPYFSSASTWASSAALPAGNFVLGGGGGSAPTATFSIVPLANGGTNANLTATNGGVVYSGASALAVTAGTATANQMLQSGASGPPSWSSMTWPATGPNINRLLWISAANTVSSLATANNGILCTSSGGVPSICSSLPTAVTAFTLTTTGTSGAATYSAGTLNIPQYSTGGSSVTWSTITSTSQSGATNSGYYANNAALVTVSLPSTCSIGDPFIVNGQGAGGWKISQASGQTVHWGNVSSTTGTAGYLSNVKPDGTVGGQYDSVVLTCMVANTDWTVQNGVGNIWVN